ncbi:MAG: hypothetical protein AAEF23_06700 [Gammaproteobacteria bacterium]
MNKNLKLIALAIGEHFSALFTLTHKHRHGVVWLSYNTPSLNPSR